LAGAIGGARVILWDIIENLIKDPINANLVEENKIKLEELIKTKTQENVNSLAKKTKEKEKAKIEVNKKLETIDPKFHDFVKFKMQENDFDFEEFKKNNQNMVIKKSTVTGITTNIKNTSEMSEQEKLLKREGITLM
jgi:hypothetical protein